MKRFLNIFLSLVIIAFIFTLPACSNTDDDDNSNTANKEYYLALGYHSITLDNYTDIVYGNANNDKVTIDESTIMLPHNSKFSITFNLSNNTNFVFNNSNYICFETGKVLSNFTDGTNTYDIYENEITLKTDISISATFENFRTAGIAICPLTDNETQKPDITKKFNTFPTTPNLLCYYSTDSSFESFENNNEKIVATTVYLTTPIALQNNKFELDICLETYLDTTKVYAYLVLIDENNCFYFFEKEFGTDFMNETLVFDNLSNANSNISKIKLSLSHDLSTREEY